MASHSISHVLHIGAVITASYKQDVAKQPSDGYGHQSRHKSVLLYLVRRACRLTGSIYNQTMPKRTYPSDAEKISVAADLEELVQDKREGWRASGAKARRRQRRYKGLLIQQLLKLGPTSAREAELDDDV